MLDPVVQAVARQMRDAIMDNDVAIVAALNRRIELVSRLRRYVEAHGVQLDDPALEPWMLRYLQSSSSGALAADALTDIYAAIAAACGPPV